MLSQLGQVWNDDVSWETRLSLHSLFPDLSEPFRAPKQSSRRCSLSRLPPGASPLPVPFLPAPQQPPDRLVLRRDVSAWPAPPLSLLIASPVYTDFFSLWFSELFSVLSAPVPHLSHLSLLVITYFCKWDLAPYKFWLYPAGGFLELSFQMPEPRLASEQ